MEGINATNTISLRNLDARLKRVSAKLAFDMQWGDTIGIKNLSDHMLRLEAKLGIAIMAPAVISLRSLDRRLQIIEKRLVAFQDNRGKIEQLLSILESIKKFARAIWDLIVRRLMG